MNYIKKISFRKKNYIYAPLFKLGQYNGSLSDPFFKYLIDILSVGKIKIKFWKPRPINNKSEPRPHVSMWVDVNGDLYFFDKSDHIQEIDYDALSICDKYFKDNYNETEIYRLLNYNNQIHDFKKIKPFFPLGDIKRFYSYYKNNDYENNFDLCQIMSLYTSPKLFKSDGYRESYPSAFDHSFIRYKTFELLSSNKKIKSFINLSTKDKTWFYPINSNYLGFDDYCQFIIKSNLGIVNTIPHRIFPWKVTEMISLATPFAIDERPITKFPPFIKLNPDEHYIEIFPGVSSLDLNPEADPFSNSSFSSLLKTYDEDIYKKLFSDFIQKIKDPHLIKYLSNNIKNFRDKTLLNRELFFGYILNA